MAALAGIIYLKKNPVAPTIFRMFVYYLCLTAIIDILGTYNAMAYYSDYRIFGFVKDTVWQSNYWLYNSFKTFSFLVYFVFFISQLNSDRSRQWLYMASAVFFISAWINLIVSGKFFVAYAAYTPIVGSVFLSICIAFYLFEILKSDRILNFYKSLSFYVAVGAILWHLTFTPMFIYNNYKVMGSSPEFFKIYLLVLSVLNFVMYGLFTLGFIIEIKKMRRLSPITKTETK